MTFCGNYITSTQLITSKLMIVILSTYAAHLVPFFDCFDGAFRLCCGHLMCLFSLPQTEMSLVLEHGVPPENIILSGVCKQLAHIKHAAKNNIQHLVCENEAELSKISRLHPNAK